MTPSLAFACSLFMLVVSVLAATKASKNTEHLPDFGDMNPLDAQMYLFPVFLTIFCVSLMCFFGWLSVFMFCWMIVDACGF
jgi:hypothetical protein